jgi:DNA polymerase elongation subunit (family B)
MIKMIVWMGEYRSRPAIRCLGASGVVSRYIREITSPCTIGTLLRHNEGTTSLNGTSPTIGSGEAKLCRDYSVMGYAVGLTIDNEHLPPVGLTSGNCCVLAYDIEVEFATAANNTSGAPILCVSMKCMCGYHLVISRARLLDSGINYVVGSNNAEIAIEVMKSIITHMPTFTVGHNIYTYDNKVLAIALPKGHKYRQYFKRVLKSDSSTSTTIGLVMTIPGINNLDTYRYMIQSMYDKFSSFSLGALCAAVGIKVGKVDNSDLRFCNEWYSSSTTNRLLMVRYNMQDCNVTLALCEKLDLINQIMSLSNAARA